MLKSQYNRNIYKQCHSPAKDLIVRSGDLTQAVTEMVVTLSASVRKAVEADMLMLGLKGDQYEIDKSTFGHDGNYFFIRLNGEREESENERRMREESQAAKQKRKEAKTATEQSTKRNVIDSAKGKLEKHFDKDLVEKAMTLLVNGLDKP